MLKSLEKQLAKKPDTYLNFDQKLTLVWSSCALNLENSTKLVQEIVSEWNAINFERTANELSFGQFKHLRDVLVYLTQASKVKNSKWLTSELNDTLSHIAHNPRFFDVAYEEAQTTYDPFKARVLKGVGEGLTMASIEHQQILEQNLVGQTSMETTFYDK